MIIGELPNLLGSQVTPGDVLHRISMLALNIDQIDQPGAKGLPTHAVPIVPPTPLFEVALAGAAITVAFYEMC